MRLRPFFILLAAAAAANASSVREEASVNTIQPTGANPRSSSFTDSLNGTIDLSSEWTLNLGGSLTLQGRTPASQRGQFPESGSVVTLFTAGADWNLTENLTLGTEAKVSPRSTQFAGTTATVRQANGTETAADAGLRAAFREPHRDGLHEHRRHPLGRLLRIRAESRAGRVLHAGGGGPRRRSADCAAAVSGPARGRRAVRRLFREALGRGRAVRGGDRPEHGRGGSEAAIQVHEDPPVLGSSVRAAGRGSERSDHQVRSIRCRSGIPLVDCASFPNAGGSDAH